MMRLDLATADYIGARSQQQDAASAQVLSGGGAVLVLADGLGGHESGAEASQIVINTFREAAGVGAFDDTIKRRGALRAAVEKANTRIANGVDPTHGHRGMASTAVAAVVAEGQLSWVSVGDSHLYVWRSGQLRKLNEDHSQAGLMIRSGQYQPDDPEVLAVKSVLVSALTGRKLEIVDHPAQSFAVERGDVLLLASDGLNTLPDEEIEAIIRDVEPQGAIKLSTTLLETVRNRRVDRQDNTTVAIARVIDVLGQPARANPEAVTEIRAPIHPITSPTEILSVNPRAQAAAPTIPATPVTLGAGAKAAADGQSAAAVTPPPPAARQLASTPPPLVAEPSRAAIAETQPSTRSPQQPVEQQLGARSRGRLGWLAAVLLIALLVAALAYVAILVLRPSWIGSGDPATVPDPAVPAFSRSDAPSQLQPVAGPAQGSAAQPVAPELVSPPRAAQRKPTSPAPPALVEPPQLVTPEQRPVAAPPPQQQR